MAKLIVMLISIGGQPAIIQGWPDLDTCNAARPFVESFYEHHQTAYQTISVVCRDFSR